MGFSDQMEKILERESAMIEKGRYEVSGPEVYTVLGARTSPIDSPTFVHRLERSSIVPKAYTQRTSVETAESMEYVKCVEYLLGLESGLQPRVASEDASRYEHLLGVGELQ